MRPVTSQRAQGHELPHQSFDVGYSKCERELEPSGKLVGAPPPRGIWIFEIKPELKVTAAVGPKAKVGLHPIPLFGDNRKPAFFNYPTLDAIFC